MNQLFWTIVWTFVGGLVGLSLQVAYERLSVLRRPSNLFGDWKSRWQPAIDSGWQWVTEEVTIKRRFGKVFITSRDNSGGYEWQGKAMITSERFLVGEWKSIKPGSHSHGVFALCVGHEGNYLCGYFFGPDMPPGKIASAFVLGRTDADLDAGTQRLKGAQVRFPDLPS